MNKKALVVVTPNFPTEILIDPISYCNHACLFCANPKIKDYKAGSIEKYIEVLSEAFSLGTKTIGIFGTGEPLIHKHICELIAGIKDIGFKKVYLKTNGSLLTKELIQKILDSNLDEIMISVGGGPKTYKIVHQVDHYKKVVENIKNLHTLKADSNSRLSIKISHVITKLTSTDFDSMANELRPYVDDIIVSQLNNQCGNNKVNEVLGQFSSKSSKINNDGICKHPFSSFTITPDFKISACDLDFSQDLIIDDLSTSSLLDIWSSPRYQKFRELHTNKNLQNTACYNCLNNTNEETSPLQQLINNE